jgi:replication factor A1
MGAIEDIFADLDAEVSESEFREAVEAKVEQMGGLADEETAAMLVAHELDDQELGGVADVEPGMEEVKFLAKVVSVGDVRTFERDGEDEDGRVLNVEVADETGSVRVAFWDEQATGAAEELEEGAVLRVAGRPQEGYSGVEVSVDRAEPEPDEDVEVAVQDTYSVSDLRMGLSDVTLRGRVLGTEAVRTFERDDGSEGQVANLLLGDETGRVRVTLWDEQTGRAAELAPGDAVEVVDGYVRERNDRLELHVGDRGSVEDVEGEVAYEPEATPIEALELDDTADVAGVVRSADPKRTFDRDDGSEGQVRNVRLQDGTDDVRVALWGEKADADVGPGDELLITDVEIQDGWQDDIEASAGWQSTLVPLGDGDTTDVGGSPDTGDAAAEPPDGGDDGTTGLDAFAGDGETDTPTDAADDGATDGESDVEEDAAFTGVVVQAGSPVILDDGERTVSVETDAEVTLGEEVAVSGTLRDGRLDADDVSTVERARAGRSGDEKG